MLRRISSPTFVGRREELAALEAALDRSAGGEFAAVFVAGESGVGKSRLLRELERRAADHEVRWLRGDCLVLAEGELPYAPITAALRSLVRSLEPRDVESLLGPARKELARLLPELGAPTELAGSGQAEPLAQARLFDLLLSVLARLGEEATAVLAIEDLHWADRSTRDFLSFLIRSAQRERLLLVCTYRSDELHRRHPLRPFLAEEERRPPVERLQLEPFSRLELAEQLGAILDSPPELAVVERLHERSEGNPFFAEELLAASADAQGPLPSTVRDALSVRLDSLPDDAVQVLRVLTAAGGRVGHRLLAAVVGLAEQRLLEVLRDAVAHQILVEAGDDSYAFRHALLQETVYADLLPGERTALHLALAETLSGDPSLAVGTGSAAAAEIAHHWRAAHRLPEALHAWMRAGTEAERAYAFAEAARHFENALELWDRVDEREHEPSIDHASLLARAAEARSLSGDDARAVAFGREAIARVDAAGDPIRSALARERLGRYLWVSGDGDAALESYQAAVRIHPAGSPTRELARVLAAEGQILMLRGRLREARDRCERAIAIAREVGARAEEGHALNTLGTAIGSLGDREAAERHLRESLRIAEEVGVLEDICRAYVNLGDALDQGGRVEDAVELDLEGARAAERLGLRHYSLFLEGCVANRLIRLGRLDEAERLIARGLDAGPGGLTAALLFENAGSLAIRRGDLDGAEGYFARALEHVTDATDSMFLGQVAAGRAEVELWRGRPQEALQTVEESLRVFQEDDELVFYTGRAYAAALAAAATIAEQSSALGDAAALDTVRERARRLMARLRKLLEPGRWEGSPPPEAPARELTCSAELARVEASPDPELWVAAADRWGALGYRFEHAYSRFREGESILMSDGDRKAASDALVQAAQEARDLGAPLLLAEVEGLARRARVPLDGAEPSGDTDVLKQLGLTDREVTVLELLTEGHTNRQIGEALFISEKTASVHVSHILAKLRVRSRTEAATAAYRLGLAPAPASKDDRDGV